MQSSVAFYSLSLTSGSIITSFNSVSRLDDSCGIVNRVSVHCAWKDIIKVRDASLLLSKTLSLTLSYSKADWWPGEAEEKKENRKSFLFA